MKKIREIFNRRKTTTASTSECTKVKEKIRVHVISLNGRILAFNVDPEKRLIDFKQEILLELYEESGEFSFDITDVWQFAEKYRLLKSDEDGPTINEQLSLEELGIEDQDTLVLQKRRYIMQEVIHPKNTEPPTAAEIWNATKNIPPSSKNLRSMDINEIFQQSDLQFDVRKVIISLAQNAAYILGAGPFAARMVVALKQKVANKKSHQEDSLQCLMEMGFTRERAHYALKLHNGVYTKSLDWLLQHQTDDIPSDDDSVDQSSNCKQTDFKNNIAENIQGLLDVVRAYSHRVMPPTQDAINALVEMGFVEKDVIKALKKTCNNKAAAVEYLVGSRTDSLIELRDGLAKDSPVLKAILDLPIVQMNLNNPKLFLAFLAILENENTTRMYSGDSETSTIITQVLQKYHEEKHALGINQFYSCL